MSDGADGRYHDLAIHPVGIGGVLHYLARCRDCGEAGARPRPSIRRAARDLAELVHVDATEYEPGLRYNREETAFEETVERHRSRVGGCLHLRSEVMERGTDSIEVCQDCDRRRQLFANGSASMWIEGQDTPPDPPVDAEPGRCEHGRPLTAACAECVANCGHHNRHVGVLLGPPERELETCEDCGAARVRGAGPWHTGSEAITRTMRRTKR